MATEDDDFLLDEDDDEATIAFILNQLPQALKTKFTEDDIYYFLDVIAEFYAQNGVLEEEPDEEGYVNIDQEVLVNYIIQEAKEDEVGTFEFDDILAVVQAEMDYGNSLQ